MKTPKNCRIWTLPLLLTTLVGAVPATAFDTPSLWLEDAGIVEAEEPEVLLTLTVPVRLDAPAGPDGVTGTLEIVGCSAAEGEDFVRPELESVTFLEGESEALVSVDVLSDTKLEGVETLHLTLSGVSGAFAADPVAEARIFDQTPLERVRGDINGDGTSDLWAIYEAPTITQPDAPRKKIVVWGLTGSSAVPYCIQDEAFEVEGAWAPVEVADLDADGLPDTIWRHLTGELAFGRTSARIEPCPVIAAPGLPLFEPEGDPSAEDFVGSGRFNLDGGVDLVTWNRTTGALSYRTVGAGLELGQPVNLDQQPDVQWRAIGVGDFDGDGWSDLLWRHAVSGYHAIWFFTPPGGRGHFHTTHTGGQYLSPAAPVDEGWKKVGVADYNGDGEDDLLFQNRESQHLALWILRQGSRICGGMVEPSRLDLEAPPEVAGQPWEIIAPR